ncbi:hypothetical protein M0812_10449 [Anaeramoeba flamelloides]|uniref:Uncharacterized protein n=1 Tax=Anaeramoeba flamelloides TaxID=1746091 RepID=A0AAV7ZVG2_9EUKA|nr:hypothetical protein M0812_10449 [Anaeramoeba flamelloides]
MLQPGALHSCSFCKSELGDQNFSNEHFNYEKRKRQEIREIQKEMKECYFNNLNIYTLRKIKRKEKETGIKFQLGNIWINELELDPTSTCNFPICWFHLLLEGLIKNIFKMMCHRMSRNHNILANKRYQKIKLPKGLKRINKPFGTNHLTSIDIQLLIQFSFICVVDLVEKKYLDFIYISSYLIKNLYQPTRNKKIDENLHKYIVNFIKCYKNCSDQNCDRISNLHIFAQHLEHSIKNNGGMNTLFFALEKYHQWYKPKYGQLHKNQKNTIFYYSKKEIYKKYLQYFKLFFRKNEKNIEYPKKNIIKWGTFDINEIKFQRNKYPFESKSIIINQHKFLLKQDAQLRNKKYVQIIKFFIYRF